MHLGGPAPGTAGVGLTPPSLDQRSPSGVTAADPQEEKNGFGLGCDAPRRPVLAGAIPVGRERGRL